MAGGGTAAQIAYREERISILEERLKRETDEKAIAAINKKIKTYDDKIFKLKEDETTSGEKRLSNKGAKVNTITYNVFDDTPVETPVEENPESSADEDETNITPPATHAPEPIAPQIDLDEMAGKLGKQKRQLHKAMKGSDLVDERLREYLDILGVKHAADIPDFTLDTADGQIKNLQDSFGLTDEELGFLTKTFQLEGSDLDDYNRIILDSDIHRNADGNFDFPFDTTQHSRTELGIPETDEELKSLLGKKYLLDNFTWQNDSGYNSNPLSNLATAIDNSRSGVTVDTDKNILFKVASERVEKIFHLSKVENTSLSNNDDPFSLFVEVRGRNKNELQQYMLNPKVAEVCRKLGEKLEERDVPALSLHPELATTVAGMGMMANLLRMNQKSSAVIPFETQGMTRLYMEENEHSRSSEFIDKNNLKGVMRGGMRSEIAPLPVYTQMATNPNSGESYVSEMVIPSDGEGGPLIVPKRDLEAISEPIKFIQRAAYTEDSRADTETRVYNAYGENPKIPVANFIIVKNKRKQKVEKQIFSLVNLAASVGEVRTKKTTSQESAK